MPLRPVATEEVCLLLKILLSLREWFAGRSIAELLEELLKVSIKQALCGGNSTYRVVSGPVAMDQTTRI
jgi:hypothetical protein